MLEEKERNPLPVALNLSLGAAHITANVYQFFFLPLYLLPLNLGWAATLIPIAFFNNSFWSLIHEAIHDLFCSNRRINSGVGRLLGVFFGSPFRVLRLSHLLHHKLNRSPLEATELYDPAKSSRFRAGLRYYFQILGGLYLFEWISSLPLFLPFATLRRIERRFFTADSVSGGLVKALLRRESLREVRRDGVAVFLVFGVSAFCYGKHWPILAAILLARAFLISFLDNVYHYKTPVNDLFYADNLRLPPLMSVALLHFNLHGIHHHHPALPWIQLPRAFIEHRGWFHEGFFRAALRQLSGPIRISECRGRVSHE